MAHRVRLLVPAAILMALGLALTGVRDIGDSPAAFQAGFGHGPTIALVHGLGSRATHWLATGRRLARTHRVQLIDLPGHGGSTMPVPFSLERAASSLDLALAEAREPVILVGHSLGGLVATAEALDHPERVRALVLIETALRPQVEGADLEGLLSALDDDYQGLLRAAYLAFGRDSVQGAKLYAEVAAMDPTVIKPWIRLATTIDLSARVKHLVPPVLVVLAERSWPPEEPWDETARMLGYTRIPNLQPMRLADCGHFVMLDRPVELADAIVAFARRVDEQIAAEVR